MDNNNKCKVMVENSAPYKVTIKRDDLMELVEIEEDELIPLTDNNAADICVSIQERLLKIQRKKLTREEIAR
jgi:hypothetical protein